MNKNSVGLRDSYNHEETSIVKLGNFMSSLTSRVNSNNMDHIIMKIKKCHWLTIDFFNPNQKIHILIVSHITKKKYTLLETPFTLRFTNTHDTYQCNTYIPYLFKDILNEGSSFISSSKRI